MSQSTQILLIEDDAAIARGLTDGLLREDYTVAWQATGRAGEAFARAHHPQLIILDVRLPDGSGFDVCRRLRQAGLRLPILMLTVQADELDKVLGLEMGADDYLTKPFGLRELLSRVRALLRRAYGELAATDGDLLPRPKRPAGAHSPSTARRRLGLRCHIGRRQDRHRQYPPPAPED